MSNIIHSTSLVDSPKQHHQDDQIAIKRYEDALVKLVQSADTPLTIALQGEWGSGKTSLMNSLKFRLSDTESPENCFHSVWVNTWEYSLMREPQEAVVKILTAIITQIGEVYPSQKAAATKASQFLSHFGKAAKTTVELAANVAAKHLAGIDNATGFGNPTLAADMHASSCSEIQQAKMAIGGIIEECIKSSPTGKKGFLFFIDDLDRIDPPVAVQILELLKNVFDIGKCIFILAIDYDVVVKGLKPKFGEYTPATEREFRSFFDKIIQVPFSMPVASYQVDDFLIKSLTRVGFLEEKDAADSDLTKALSFFCKSSVGTNPRSLKRLVNILSLIQLLNEEGDIPDKIQKQVDFALVCLQISFPRVYGCLGSHPDFRSWDASFRKRQGLGELDTETKEKLSGDELFDEEWEQSLYLLCKENPYLHRMGYQISAILNRLATLETQDSPISERIQASIRTSAVTNVSPEVTVEQVVHFHQSSFLHRLNDELVEKTLPLAQERGLVDFAQILSRIQTRLKYQARLSGANTNIELSVCPIDDKYRCQISLGYWMLWNEKNQGNFETELGKIGRTKQQFDAITYKIDNLGSNHSEWLRPQVDRPNEIRRGKSEKYYYFDFGTKFKYYAKSPDDFLHNDFVATLSEMVVELLCLRGEITEFLKGGEADTATSKP
jgi:hypothetical protein